MYVYCMYVIHVYVNACMHACILYDMICCLCVYMCMCVCVCVYRCVDVYMSDVIRVRARIHCRVFVVKSVSVCACMRAFCGVNV
jgi:hypothetical protein